jgi:hypothetical protein
MALGELIIEDKGKITGQRVLDVEGPKIENSFVMDGKYKGAEGILILELTLLYWDREEEEEEEG